MLRSSLLAAAIPLSASLAALDLPGTSQIRLTYGPYPGVDVGKYEMNLAGLSLVDEFPLEAGKGSNFEAGYLGLWIKDGAKVGLAVYAGIFARSMEGKDDNGIKTTAKAVGINLGLDLAIRPIEALLLSAGPRLGIGSGDQTIAAPTWKDARGTMVALSLQAGAYFCYGQIVLGIEGGYTSWSSHATHDYNDGFFSGQAEVTLSGSGPYGSAVIGIAF